MIDPKHRSKPTIDELAVRILRNAVVHASGARVDRDDVRLALRVLLARIGDRGLLAEFWAYAGQLHHAGRSESCSAVLASILDDLRAGARYPSEDVERRRWAVERIRDGQIEREMKRDVQRRHYFTPPRPRQR